MRFLAHFLLLGVLSAFVLADEDHEQARRLKEAGEILPLQQIIKKAKSIQQGRVIDVEFENEDGLYVYEVEMLDSAGEVWELYFDAATGELVKRGRED